MNGYTQLKIVLPLRSQEVKGFTYKLTVVDHNTTPSSEQVLSGTFDAKGMSARHALERHDVELFYEVSVQGQFIKKISCKAYPSDSKQHSVYRFKATKDSTRPEPNHLKEVVLDGNEVAWYLVKKTETMGALMDRIYQQEPGAAEWKVLKENNPHLGTVSAIKNLLPGQVVVLANTSKVTPKLQQYRVLAKQAEDKRRGLHERYNDFDAEFFAQHYEFFYDAMDPEAGNQAWLSHKQIPTFEGTTTTADAGQGLSYGAIAKGTIDGAMQFVDTSNKQVMQAYAEITKAMAAEKKAGSRLANPKNFNEFKAKYAGHYSRLDNALGQNLFRWDTGTKTNNMRRVIQRDAFVRGASYKGGLEAYAKNLSETGRVARTMKAGGNLLVAYDAFGAGKTIYDAAQSGDMDKLHKTVAVEPLKLAGSVVGGRVGGAGGVFVGGLIVAATVGTGGLAAIVIVGVCAVGGGLALGAAGGEFGEWIGNQVYSKTKI